MSTHRHAPAAPVLLAAAAAAVAAACAAAPDPAPAAGVYATAAESRDDALARAIVQEQQFRSIVRLLALPADVRAEREAQLAAALDDFFADRSELHAVWVGRRLAYLGLFDLAISWYTVRIAEFPDSYRLRRHLGHRLITQRDAAAAIPVLERARALAAEAPNELEPDGQPNAAGIPVSTTHGNLDYHLALAYYCERDFEAAAAAWRRCFERWAANDDGRVSSGHWLATTLRRLGRDEEAAAVVEAIGEAPDVIENFSYRDLIDLYAGRTTPDALLGAMEDPAQDAGRAYGVARWLIDRGEGERGIALLDVLAREGAWASFGRIAAEADLGIAPPLFGSLVRAPADGR